MSVRMAVALLEALPVLQNHKDAHVQRGLGAALALTLEAVYSSAFVDELLPYIPSLRDWLEVGWSGLREAL